MITTQIKKYNDAKNNIDLAIDQMATMKIKLRGGEISVAGVKTRLDDIEYVVPQSQDKMAYLLYLMTKKDTKEVALLVDEVGPSSLPLDMTADPDYDYLFQIGCLFVPEKAKNLDEATLNVYSTSSEEVKQDAPPPAEEN